ncbi:hypothetical protein D3C80_1225070 [compost metagenome]
MVTVKPSLRGMRKVQGVASHWKPFEVEARAPGGLLSTVNGWVVPRVIVAQAGRLRLNPASVRACTAKRA